MAMWQLVCLGDSGYMSTTKAHAMQLSAARKYRMHLACHSPVAVSFMAFATMTGLVKRYGALSLYLRAHSTLAAS